MSLWACTSGNWYTSGTCVTNPKDATFLQPITMNIYAINASNPAQPKAGALLGTLTQTFQIPYRPSTDTIHCPMDNAAGSPAFTRWYNQANGQCYHGLATPITFNFGSKNLSVAHAAAASPSATNGVIIGIEFNTTTAGPNPLGVKPCRSTSQGCPYDSLNVSIDGDVFAATDNSSSVLDPNGIFFNYISLANACNHGGTTGVFQDDTVPNNGEPATEFCFTGLHPQLQIQAQCGGGGHPFCPSVVGGNNPPGLPGQ